MKKRKSLIIASVIILLLPIVVPISAKKMRALGHDGPRDWFTIYVGTPSAGYNWLDIIMTSVEQDGDFLILSTTVRGRIPEHHPDGINAAFWWGFDTDKDPDTGWRQPTFNYGYFGQECAVQVKYFGDDREWRALLHVMDEDGNTVEVIEFGNFSIKGSRVTDILPLEFIGNDNSFHWRANTYDYNPHPGGNVDISPDDTYYEFN